MNHQQSRALDRGDDEPGTTDRQSAADFMVTLALALLSILLSPLLLACWLERRFSPSDRWLMASGELLSLVPGAVGNLARKALYRATIQDCAKRAYISFGTLIVNRRAAVGDRAFIGPYCILGAAHVGAEARLASRVSVMSGRHHHGSAQAGVTRGGDWKQELVTIGEGAWVGEGAIVMANVGRDCIVGAGSVVTREVPDGTTVVGNPARPIVGPS
jgi:virginiamycin A acetyltransferase